MKSQKTLTLQEARDELLRKGLSVRRWAIKHGYNPNTARNILNGKLNYRIGKSHNIAVALGIKDGEIVE